MFLFKEYVKVVPVWLIVGYHRHGILLFVPTLVAVLLPAWPVPTALLRQPAEVRYLIFTAITRVSTAWIWSSVAAWPLTGACPRVHVLLDKPFTVPLLSLLTVTSPALRSYLLQYLRMWYVPLSWCYHQFRQRRTILPLPKLTLSANWYRNLYDHQQDLQFLLVPNSGVSVFFLLTDTVVLDAAAFFHITDVCRIRINITTTATLEITLPPLFKPLSVRDISLHLD